MAVLVLGSALGLLSLVLIAGAAVLAVLLFSLALLSLVLTWQVLCSHWEGLVIFLLGLPMVLFSLVILILLGTGWG